jgi:hypothetical protein
VAREVEAVAERLGPRFARSEPRQRAVGYLRGLLGDAERKNGWQLAEPLGEATPDGVQPLLARADGDADAVRDDRLGNGAEHLGDPGGVRIVDEHADGRAGGRRGIARPAGDGRRGVRVGLLIPDRPGKSRLGLRPGGADGLRGHGRVRAKALLAEVPADAWPRLSSGAGRKGPRWYEWARTRLNCPNPPRCQRWRLIRRSPSRPSDVSDFVCGGRPATALAESVTVAGKRWVVEECFEPAEGGGGLDEYEVRSRTGWHRHVTLGPFALAVVAVIRSRVRPARREKGASARSAGACPRSGSYSSNWCERSSQKPKGCWRGRRGGGDTNTGQWIATTRNAGPDRPTDQLRL